ALIFSLSRTLSIACRVGVHDKVRTSGHAMVAIGAGAREVPVLKPANVRFGSLPDIPLILAAREELGTMSALPPKADMGRHRCHVRFVPKADITEDRGHGRFLPIADIVLPIR